MPANFAYNYNNNNNSTLNAQPTVGGAAPATPAAPTPVDGSSFVLDHKSGLYYDPKTQNFFSKDPSTGGFTVMRDPNVASSVASFYGAGNKYAAAADPYAVDFGKTFDAQNNLATSLGNTINNPNAPSVAHEQLAQALNANDATQMSGASGIGGENAFLARRNANNNIAGLDAASGQSAALLRAQEVAGAQNNLGNVLGQQSGEASGMFGTNTNAALAYNQLGAGTKESDLGNQTAQRGQNIDLTKGAFTGAGSAASSAVTNSDPELKHDIHEERPEDIHAFLSALQPESWKYNDDDPEDPERHGVMTTDLEKSDIGRSLIRDVPGGKGYDQGQGLGAALAALGDMHRRVTALEGRKRG